MPEHFSVSVPTVANDICRSAVPAPKYLLERRSTAFPHHYTADDSVPKIIVNDTINAFLKTAVGILPISNHNSLRVLADKIASVYFISKIY